MRLIPILNDYCSLSSRQWMFCILFFADIALASPLQADKRISLQFHQAPIGIILQSLAEHQQLNLILLDHPTEALSIRLHDVPWQQALDLVLRSSKLAMTLEGNVMLISRPPDPHLKQKNQQQLATEQENQLPLDSIRLKINYADINELANKISAQKGILLSERANIVTDSRTQQIIIHDTAPRLRKISTFIDQLDVAEPQVQISAKIVTMSSESLQELGVKWTLDNSTVGNVSAKAVRQANNINLNLSVFNPTSQIGFQLARLNGNFLNLELSALEAENSVEIIANPRLLTRNQQTASIKQGTEIPYEVSNGNSGNTSIEFKQAVLGLEVTPKILNNDRLVLSLHLTQNTPGQAIKRSDGGESLTIDTQEIKTQVIVNNGETLVLGGIFQQNNIKARQSVPILAAVPVVGALFRHDLNKQSRRELVIFITPQIYAAAP